MPSLRSGRGADCDVFKGQPTTYHLKIPYPTQFEYTADLWLVKALLKRKIIHSLEVSRYNDPWDK
jgi:hypothetical protein